MTFRVAILGCGCAIVVLRGRFFLTTGFLSSGVGNVQLNLRPGLGSLVDALLYYGGR